MILIRCYNLVLKERKTKEETGKKEKRNKQTNKKLGGKKEIKKEKEENSNHFLLQLRKLFHCGMLPVL